MKKAFWLFVVGCALFSCTDKTQINLVSGSLNEQCGVAIANQEIALKANVGASFTDPIIIASGISKSDGTYNFTYELGEEQEGTGEFILINPTGFTTLIRDIPLNEDVSFDYYEQDSILITVMLEGDRAYTSSDTLFFGYNGTEEEFSIIQPTNGELVNIESTLLEEYNTTTRRRIYYGIGEKDFAEAKSQTTIEIAVRNIDLNITACNLNDTARIVIN